MYIEVEVGIGIEGGLRLKLELKGYMNKVVVVVV